jgi:hypothetical protein
MGARYSATGQGTLAATTQMLYFSNPASGFRRLALYELIQGSDPTPGGCFR